MARREKNSRDRRRPNRHARRRGLAAYERLRRCVLGQASDADAGLALLLRRGVRAWLETRCERSVRAPAAPACTGTTLGNDLRDELTRLVAMMALGITTQEGHI